MPNLPYVGHNITFLLQPHLIFDLVTKKHVSLTLLDLPRRGLGPINSPVFVRSSVMSFSRDWLIEIF